MVIFTSHMREVKTFSSWTATDPAAFTSEAFDYQYGGGNKVSVAMAYGKRLADHAQNMREGAVEKLAKGYPSHDFIIDYAEAQVLFSSIEKPTMALYRLLGCLDDLVYSQQNIALVRRIQRPTPQTDDSRRAPESSALSSRASDQAPVEEATTVAEESSSTSEQPRRKPKRSSKGRKKTLFLMKSS